MPISTGLQIVGVAKEAAGSPGVAVAPTNYIKFEKFDPHPVIGEAFDMSQRADMADKHGATQTTIYVEIDFDIKVAPDDLGWLLVNLYGADAVTGAAAPYTHTLSLLNTITAAQGPTHTFTHFNGVETRRYAYARVSECTFKYVAGELVGVTGKMMAASQATTTVPVPAFSAVPPIAAWATTVSVGGAQASVFTELEVHISRTVTPIFTLANVQTPYSVMAGGDFKATVKGKAVYETAALFGTTYLAGGTSAVVANTTTGAATALMQIQHTLSAVYFNDAKITPGSQYMELNIDGEGMSNATDAGSTGGAAPIKTVLQNAIAVGVYN